MTKLTAGIKKEITKEWQALFPDMAIYEDLWLMKRYGPVVIGIYLEVLIGNEKYRPLSHINNLCSKISRLPFVLPQMVSGLRGGQVTIPVLVHNERYKEVAHQLVTQSLLPLKGDLTFPEIINIYMKYMKMEEELGHVTRFHPHKIEGLLLLYTWEGKPYEEIKKMLDGFRNEMTKWPPRSLAMLGEYGLQGWYDKMDAIIKDREKVLKTVEDEVVAHKLEKIPYHDLPLK